MEQGQPLLAFVEAVNQELSRALTDMSGPSQQAPDPQLASALVLLAPALLLSESKMPMLGEGRVHIYREGNHLRPDPHSFCSSNLGSDPTPIG